MQRNYRKSDTAGAKLGYLGHGLMDNHYGLMTDAKISQTDERTTGTDIFTPGIVPGLFYGLAFGIGGFGAAALGYLADIKSISI